MTRIRRKQQGFTFTEILIVLAIIAGVTVLVLSQANVVINAGAVDRAASDIRAIISTSQRFRVTRPSYEDISAKALNDRGLLPGHLSQAAARNPWGGLYLIGATTGNDRLVIALTELPDKNTMNALTDVVGNIQNACTASGGTRTSSATLGVTTCPTSFTLVDGTRAPGGTGTISYSNTYSLDTTASGTKTEKLEWAEGGTWGYAFR